MKFPNLNDVNFKELFTTAQERVTGTNIPMLEAIIKHLEHCSHGEPVLKNDVINVVVANSEDIEEVLSLIPVVLRLLNPYDETSKMAKLALTFSDNKYAESLHIPNKETDEFFISEEEGGEILHFLETMNEKFSTSAIITSCKFMQSMEDVTWKHILLLYTTLWEASI